MVATATVITEPSALVRSPQNLTGEQRLEKEKGGPIGPIGGERSLTIERQSIKRSPPEPDSAANWDRLLRARIGKLSYGLSPPGLSLVFLDWLLHLGFSPGKQLELMRKVFRKGVRFGAYAARAGFQPGTPPAIEPLPQDRRFVSPEWQKWPFNLYYQSFLFTQQWLHNATTDVRGVSNHDEAVVNFVARQLLDILSPVNFPWTNPEVLKTTITQGVMNFVRGALNFIDDCERAVTGRKAAGFEAFPVGKAVAAR